MVNIISCGDLHYAYLSGEHREIPLGELKAVLEAEGIGYETVYIDEQLYLFKSKNVSYDKIIHRVAYTKELGPLLALTHDISVKGLIEMIDGIDWSFIRNKKFIVRAKHIGGYHSKETPTPYVERLTGKRILEHLNYMAKVEPTSPDITVRLLFSKNIAIVGVLKAKLDTKYFLKVRPRKRPFYYPGVLEPKIARAFVNFSRVKRGDVFLDPFCGTGGFLIEACNIGAYTIGYDIKKLMSYGAKQNIEYYDLLKYTDILRADATLIPLRSDSVDAISTDPPYGRVSSTLGRNLKDLISQFLEQASTIIKKYKYICFATPHTLNVLEYIDKYGLKLIEKYTMKVHRSLTRVIYVVRRED